MRHMQELDKLYGTEKIKDDEELENEEIDEPTKQNPFMKPKKMTMKHQEYRTIEVGPPDMLKNGQMI